LDSHALILGRGTNGTPAMGRQGIDKDAEFIAASRATCNRKDNVSSAYGVNSHGRTGWVFQTEEDGRMPAP
jgi:hypothetical protein